MGHFKKRCFVESSFGRVYIFVRKSNFIEANNDKRKIKEE